MAKNKFTGNMKGDNNSDVAVDEPTNGVATTSEAKGPPKSIVPTKYAGKYKGGGSDALAVFINEQSTVEGKFSFDRFFELCKANGVVATEVDKYKAQVDQKIGGAAGRARMTLRNRLTPIARSGKGMKGLDGETYDVKLPALAKKEAVPA